MAEVLAGKSHLSAAQAARITEPMVGITEYANSSHPGFRGTMKYRYSDFIVREVSLAREVVKLTDTSDKIAIDGAAVVIEGAAVANSEEAITKVAGGETTVVNGGGKMSGSEAGVAEMEALVGKELTERIIALVKKASKEQESDTKDEDLTQWEVVLEPDTDKAKRTAVHRCIRAHFAPLESDSVKVGDAPTAVRVFHPRGKSGAWREGALRGREQPMQRGGGANERGAKRQRTDCGTDRIDPKYKYLRFTLFKENRDTMGAISELCRHTQLAPRKFSYAGTKDRRACTAQFVTIPRADSKHVIHVNRKIRFGMLLGNFVYCEEQLRLGDLYGNRFELVLRDVEADSTLLRDACESLRTCGFINYYGLQRFGTSAVATHEIGRALLREDFAAAAHLVLCPRAGEKEESTSARQRFAKEQDFGKALEYFPRYMHAERALLEGYRKHGKDAHQSAVQGLPRNLRLMYVHAYQSFVWNRIVGLRVRQHGLKAVEGDLVLVEGEEAGVAEDDAPVAVVAGEKEGGGDERGKRWSEDHPKSVKVLSAAEAAQTSVFDVVLSLPGTSVVYPAAKGVTKADYGELMKEDGLDIEKMETKAREFTLSGDYRRMLARADDLSWEQVTYRDPYADLQATDKDVLAKPPRSTSAIREAAMSIKKRQQFQKEIVEGEEQGGGRQSVTQLRSSTYATMAMRELLKGFSEEAALGLRRDT